MAERSCTQIVAVALGCKIGIIDQGIICLHCIGSMYAPIIVDPFHGECRLDERDLGSHEEEEDNVHGHA